MEESDMGSFTTDISNFLVSEMCARLDSLEEARSDGGECPFCHCYIESEFEKENCDAELKRIENLSEDECRNELEAAGIDADKGLESSNTVVKLCKQINALVREIKELKAKLKGA